MSGKIVLGALVLLMSSLSCLSYTSRTDNQDISAQIQTLKLQIENLTSEEFIKEDYFLENWLRLKDFDVQITFESLTEYIQWRAKENISTILEENWFDMRAKFPYSLDTVDKFNRPVLYIDVALWDFTTYLDDGEEAYSRLVRYIFMHHEEVLVKIRELRSNGKNTTQLTVVANLADFSAFQMACVKCLQLVNHVTDFGAKFGIFSLSKVVLVNVPYFFKIVYFFLSAEVRTYFELYGQDRSQWEPIILNLLQQSQLPAGLFAELPTKDNLDGLITWNKEL